MVKVLSFIFQQCFGLFPMVVFEGSSETGLFTHSTNHVFWSPLPRKYISYEGHLFSENVKHMRYISKMQKKIDKKFFLFERIASELVALNSLY